MVRSFRVLFLLAVLSAALCCGLFSVQKSFAAISSDSSLPIFLSADPSPSMDTADLSAAGGVPSDGDGAASAVLKLDAARVVRVDLAGPVTPATADLIQGALRTVREQGGDILLIRLDTPGGLVESMRKIVKDISNAPVPVLVWVGPAASRAMSAGVFIVAASDAAAMASDAAMGAASPVNAGGSEVPETMKKKITSDLNALMRSLLQGKERNVGWYIAAVEESVSVTGSEALENGVIEFAAESVSEFLESAGKAGVRDGGRVVRFSAESAVVIDHQPSARYRILSWLLDPQIAYLLLLGGMAGLFFELTTPGAIFPGVLGGLSLLLGLYSLSILPTNVAGLLLILFAVVLFILELGVTSYGMLSVAGTVSLFIGSLLLFEESSGFGGVPLSTVIATTGGVAAFLAFVVYAVAKAHFRRPPSGEGGLVGGSAEITEWEQQRGKVFYQGTLWNAKSLRPERFAPGAMCRVTGNEGLTLVVTPMEEEAAPDDQG